MWRYVNLLNKMSTLTTHTEMLKLFNYDLQNFASISQ